MPCEIEKIVPAAIRGDEWILAVGLLHEFGVNDGFCADIFERFETLAATHGVER